MHKVNLYIRTFLLLLLIAGVGLSPADAQRKKKKKKKKKDKTEVYSDFSFNEGQPPSEKDLREAEVYFIEGEKYFMLENYAKAYVLYQRALDLHPESPALNYRISQLLIKTQEYDKALIYASKALALDTENKYYYLLEAEIYTKKGNLSSAAESYEKMLAKIPGTEQYLFDLAALYLYNNKFEQALDAYDRAEVTYGILPEIIAQKQKIYLKLNDLEGAVAEGEKLIKNFPGEAIYVNELAELLVSNEQYDRAIPLLTELLKEYDNNPQSELLLATIYRAKGSLEKAAPYYVKAFKNPSLDLDVKLPTLASMVKKLPNADMERLVRELSATVLEAHPKAADAHAINGDIYFAINNKDAALTHYKNAISLDESNFSIWQNIMQMEYEQQAWDSVIFYSDRAMELFPNQTAVYYFGGTAHLIRKNYEEAVYALEQGATLSFSKPELNVMFLSQLGDAYNGMKAYEKSDQAYEDVLTKDPDNSYVLNNYSYYLSLRKEKLQEALKMSTKLIKMHPENANYLDTHAWVLYNLGRYEEALYYLEKAVAKNPNGTIIEHYGDVLFKLGKVEEAVNQWREAKGMDSTSDLIDKKIADKRLYE